PAIPPPLPTPTPFPYTTLFRSDPVRRLLGEAKVDLRTTRGLPPFMAGSTCHSLWIVLKDRHRSWYSFSVLDQGDEKHPRGAAFVDRKSTRLNSSHRTSSYAVFC